jgi:putative ABC transport system ATP-binding protein
MLPLIVADEPTGRLDSVTAEGILDIFSRLVSAGKTLLMVTHDESMAERVTRKVQIVDGEIRSQEPTPAGAKSYAS